MTGFSESDIVPANAFPLQVRMSTMVDTGRFGKAPAWRHAKCFHELGWWTKPIDELPGWDSLGADNQKVLQDLFKSSSKGSKTGNFRCNYLMRCYVVAVRISYCLEELLLFSNFDLDGSVYVSS